MKASSAEPLLLSLLRTVIAAREERAGASLAVVEDTLRAGAMPPLHAQAHDEALAVLDGVMVLHVGRTAVRLDPGDSFLVPAGTPHTYRAETTRVRYVSAALVPSAGAYEQFLRAVSPVERAAEPADLDGWATSQDAAVLAAVTRGLDVTVLGPPGALPIDLPPRRRDRAA